MGVPPCSGAEQQDTSEALSVEVAQILGDSARDLSSIELGLGFGYRHGPAATYYFCALDSLGQLRKLAASGPFPKLHVRDLQELAGAASEHPERLRASGEGMEGPAI